MGELHLFSLPPRSNSGRLSHVVWWMILATNCLLVQYVQSVPLSRTYVKKYLEDFGYIEPVEGIAAAEIDSLSLRRALIGFQSFIGLPETGKEDNETLTVMKKPRCGNSDLPANSRRTKKGPSKREKRWVIFRAWPKSNLTYRISSYTSDLATESVDDAAKRAFQLWSDVALIDFTRVWTPSADIDISFQTRNHGDGIPFDGPGNVLGHSFPPQLNAERPDLIGTIHMDEDETWTVGSTSGRNLWLTLAHEIGHAIGLSHSEFLPAVMYPLYPAYDPNFQLHEDDIRGIQFLYGARPGAELPYPAVVPGGPNNPSVPNLCAEPPESMTINSNGQVLAFKDNYYWHLEQGQIERGFPKLISETWKELQSDLTAILTVKNSRVWGSNAGKTYFFKKRAVWRYSTDFFLDPGFPYDIHTVFPSIPSTVKSVDAALEISGNGETLFIIDGELYLYGWQNTFHGPYNIQKVIPNLNGKILSAIQLPDNYLYFFTDSGMYYQVSPWTFNISARFPKAASQDWFNCNALRSISDIHDGTMMRRSKRTVGASAKENIAMIISASRYIVTLSRSFSIYVFVVVYTNS